MKKIFAAFFVLSLLNASSVWGTITFTIDTFTSDELTITIPANAASTLTGSAPNSNARAIHFRDSSFNADWVNSGASSRNVTDAGSIGSATTPASPSLVNNINDLGDFVVLSFSNDLVSGAAVTDGFSFTITGSNIFSPEAMTGPMTLVWGSDGRVALASSWGSVQGTAAIPEPTFFGGALGLVALLVGVRRQRRRG